MIDIKPSQRNTNKHTKDGMDLLENSINKVGVIESISVASDGTIISGHARFEHFEKQGKKPIEIHLKENEYPVIVTDIENNSKEYFEAQILANTTANKNFDLDIEMIEVIAEEFDIDIEEIGVEVVEVEEDTILEATEDDFDATPPETPITVLGDLYEIGKHRLLCGDSTDSDVVAKLMNGEKADMVFTSPPYNANTKFTNVKNEGKLYENYDDNLSSKEYIEFAESVLEICFLNTEGFIFWNVNYNTNSKNEFIKQIYNRIDFLEELICWKKTALPVPSGLTRTWEPIFVFKTNKELKRIGTLNKTEFNFWDINNSGALDKSHRAAFPIKLVEKSLNLVVNAKIILEPFCGSGTTMVASHQLKRKCYGMELDPKYCDVIVKRMIKLDDTLTVKRNGVDCTNEFKDL